MKNSYIVIPTKVLYQNMLTDFYDMNKFPRKDYLFYSSITKS